MGKTKIEWAEKAWNPVTGCTKISAGCQNCYAERMAKRLAGRCGYDKDDPFTITGGWDGRTAEMKVYDKWHKPPDDARLVDYDSFEELAGKYLKTQLVLREAFELLEKHMPPWYLRKHYNRIVEVLEDVED